MCHYILQLFLTFLDVWRTFCMIQCLWYLHSAIWYCYMCYTYINNIPCASVAGWGPQDYVVAIKSLRKLNFSAECTLHLCYVYIVQADTNIFAVLYVACDHYIFWYISCRKLCKRQAWIFGSFRGTVFYPLPLIDLFGGGGGVTFFCSFMDEIPV